MDSVSGAQETGGSLSTYVEGWRERARLRQRAENAYRDDLLARLPAAVDCLRERFGASRVILFGSLARGDASVGSDVDLLVEGVVPAELVAATVALERICRPAHVDLVPMQSARPEVRERALQEGRVLFGQ